MTDAQLVSNVWLPATEVHMVNHILHKSKAGIVQGRGTYQKHKLDRAMAFVPPGRRRVALDIGGHCGTWGMWLVRMFDHVEAFEPIPLHRELYARNVPGPIDAGEKIGTLNMHACALADCAGDVWMRTQPTSTGSAYIAQDGDQNVECRTLDSFGIDVVDFIKIDTEGHELPVLLGGERTIRANKPIMVVEQKGWNAAHVRDGNKSARNLLLSWGAIDLARYAGDHIIGW